MKAAIVFSRRPLSWRPISWSQWIVRKVTRCPWDHVAFAYQSKEFQSEMILESTIGYGVSVRPRPSWVKHREWVSVKDRPISQSRVGRVIGVTKYDVWSLFRHLFRVWFYRGKKKESSKMTCSEFVGYVLGWENWWKMSPADVFKKLRENGEI